MNNTALRIILFHVCAILSVIYSSATTTEDAGNLSFKIEDAVTRHPLSDVTCRVFTVSGKFYNYAISDIKGMLYVRVNEGDSLKFSRLGYEEVTDASNHFSIHQINSIKLSEKCTELREVVVKAPPIRQKNDTIAYDVRAFTKQGDTHLEDILKKLPGIKVAENGSISYQGKAINRFYIEGKDLLGMSYNQASKNMPIDAVTTVEVLENHQPIKMLKENQFSDKAAINIRIDKGHRALPFGELKAGLGEIASIWNNSLFLTQIMGNSQLLISGKMNNTGENLSDETKEHIDVTDLDAYEPLLPSVLSASSIQEILAQKRYLVNKSYSAGLNYLVGISPESTLRFNLLFYRDHSSAMDSLNRFYGGEMPFNLREINSKEIKDLTILPIIKYELNSKKSYISNELKFSFNKNSSTNSVNSNHINVFEKMENAPVYIQNYFTSAFSVHNHVIQAKSFLRYLDRNEKLYSSADTISYYDVSERFAVKSFINKSILSSSFYLWGNTLNVSSEIYYRHALYAYKDNIDTDKLSVKVSPNYVISLGTDRSLSIVLPVKLFDINVLNSHKIRFAFIPNINFKYQINNEWRINANGMYDMDNNTLGFYSPYSLRTGYRTEYLPANNIFFSTSKRCSLTLAYRNLVSMLFSNLTVAYSDNKREDLSTYSYTDSITQISTIALPNHHKTLLVNGSFDKSFIDAGIALKSGLNYSNTRYLVSQSDFLFENNSNIFGINIDLIYQKFRWFKIMLATTGSLYWEKNDIYSSLPFKSMTVNTSVFFFPINNLTAILKYQNYINEITASKYKDCGLFDFNLKYKLNKRWELEFSLSNILNTRSYTVTQESGINTFNTTLPLRGREYLLSVLWRF